VPASQQQRDADLEGKQVQQGPAARVMQQHQQQQQAQRRMKGDEAAEQGPAVAAAAAPPSTSRPAPKLGGTAAGVIVLDHGEQEGGAAVTHAADTSQHVAFAGDTAKYPIALSSDDEEEEQGEEEGAEEEKEEEQEQDEGSNASVFKGKVRLWLTLRHAVICPRGQHVPPVCSMLLFCPSGCTVGRAFDKGLSGRLL
jgi:hypothetical protein